MNKEDKDRFLQNYAWFNQFFSDMKALFDKIGNELTNKRGLEEGRYYYPKSNFQPGIPPYMVMAQGGGHFAVQYFAIFDPSIIENEDAFKVEPSVIVVQYGRGDRVLYPSAYGLKVMALEGTRQTEVRDGVARGVILEKKEVPYIAFQIPFQTFASGDAITEIIQTEIAAKLEDFQPD